MIKKLSIIFYAIVLMQGMLVACAGNDVSTNTTETSTNSPQSIQPNETTESLWAEIEAVDYSTDAPFRIWGRKVDDDGFPNGFYDVYATGYTGDSINDVVYERNLKVEDKYNTKLEVIFSDNPVNSILAASDDFDIMYPMLYDAMNYAAKGLLQDISEYNYLNFEAPWWMNSTIENLTAHGKLFVLSCDVNISSFDCIPVIFFNKAVAEEYQVPNLYALVDSGDWTFETFTTLCQGLSSDLNGDQALTEVDQYGLAVNNFGYIGLFYGTGETFITKESGDTWSLDITGEKKLNILSDIVKLLNDETINLFGEKYDSLIKDGRALIPQQTFYENRSLFWIELMSGASLLRNMKTDFGILPMPKYDETQENYISFLHAAAGVFCVPITNNNEDKTGHIAEDLARYSHDMVKPAYIEVLVKSKIGRDEDSARMIDIIHQNVTVDFSMMITNIDSDVRKLINSNNTDFSSMFAKRIKSYEKSLSSYYNSISELE